jgi:hypothetical protein
MGYNLTNGTNSSDHFQTWENVTALPLGSEWLMPESLKKNDLMNGSYWDNITNTTNCTATNLYFVVTNLLKNNLPQNLTL